MSDLEALIENLCTHRQRTGFQDKDLICRKIIMIPIHRAVEFMFPPSRLESIIRMRIRLFGDSSITLGGVPVTWVPTNFFRILAYLLLEESSQSISCSKLAQIFWSDSDQSHALINLRQSLARIRRFQDQYALNLIRADAMFVSLNLEQVEAGLVWIDALDLLKVFQDGDIKSVLEYSEECRGSLLAQYLPQQSDFDNWLDVKRAKLHEVLTSPR